MHKTLLEYGISNYDTTNFSNVNEKIYLSEEECYSVNGYYNALSLISVMLVDLGIIILSDFDNRL